MHEGLRDYMLTAFCYRRCLFIAIAIMMILIATFVFLSLQHHALDEAPSRRRIALAATATSLAMSANEMEFYSPPSPASPTPNMLIPTTQDLAILPTSTFTMSPGTMVPTPASLFPEQLRYELVNILVLGSDQYAPTQAYRTDVILIVSVNWTTQTVNLLSIPRDLYVYIPGWGMDRINTAELHQTQTNQTNHRLGLLAETIEYNLGLRIDHIARIDFEGFEAVVDLFGGVTVPIDCPVSGYQPVGDGSWEPFTLEPGLRILDGNMSLWYVRQRMDSSDFDRNRRQQIVLRALWRKVVTSNLAAQLPELWGALSQFVETDVTLDQALLYIPLLTNLNASKIESHFLGLDEVNLGQSPSGASVLFIDHEPLVRTLSYFLTPPIENQLGGELSHIEVINSSSFPNAEYIVAAQLEWAGLVATPVGSTDVIIPRTQVYDYAGQFKNKSRETIRQALNITESDVLFAVSEANQPVDFRVVVGDNYRSCMTSPWIAFPQPE